MQSALVLTFTENGQFYHSTITNRLMTFVFKMPVSKPFPS